MYTQPRSPNLRHSVKAKARQAGFKSKAPRLAATGNAMAAMDVFREKATKDGANNTCGGDGGISDSSRVRHVSR